MKPKIIPKQEIIPSYDANAIAIKHIQYYPYEGTYSEDEITPVLISNILKEIPDGIEIYLFLDPDGEDDWLEVNCDGKWIAIWFWGDLGENTYFSYNPAFVDTAGQVSKMDFSDKSIYTDLKSGGQSPIAKIHALTDIETGIKAVEYFIRTGAFYPGIDWLHEYIQLCLLSSAAKYTPEGGIDIGLHLARETVTMQGVYIKATSSLGQGSMVSIFLPRR